MEEYNYTPLPTPTSIRLLRIDKRDESGLFHCSLKTVDLDDFSWYHAYSYTWGNPHAEGPMGHAFMRHYEEVDSEYAWDAKNAILCNGKRLYVNRNLHDSFGAIPTKYAWKRFINKQRHNEWNSLHASALSVLPDKDMEESIRQLLSSGADLDATDNNGATAINWAARMGHLGRVKLLAEAGAHTAIRDSNGKTALDWARENNYSDIVDYLENFGEPLAVSALEPTREGPEVWAWIDQICINQEDQQERCLQVGIMDQVYLKAAFTLIWLGREDSYTKTAVSTIYKIVSMGERFVNSDIMPYSVSDRDAYIKAGVPYISGGEWEALAALFQRQYFRRLWVVQENVLSKTVICYCGTVKIPFEKFGTAAQLLEYRNQQMGFPPSSMYVPLNEAVRSIEKSVAQLVDWKGILQYDVKAKKLGQFNEETLILHTWTYRATDPRDKIYGLYGLVSRHSSTPMEWKVDYKKSTEQVFAEASKRIMIDSGELKWLCLVFDHSKRQIATLPSWVPDYSLPFTTMRCASYRAAGKFLVPSPLFSLSEPWNQLTIHGVRIDTVIRTGTTTAGATDHHRFFDPSWIELALLIPSKYQHTNQPRSEALWRTLCMNQNLKQVPPAPPHYRSGFHDMIARMLVRVAWREAYISRQKPELGYSLSLKHAVDFVLQMWSRPPYSDLSIDFIERDFSSPSHKLYDQNHQCLHATLLKVHVLSMIEGHDACTPALEHLLEAEKILDAREVGRQDPVIELYSPKRSVSEFVTSCQTTVGGRRLFVTSRRFLGLGPRGMKEGDGVWVLPGTGALFILRQRDDSDSNDKRYMLIGEAYVHGLMDGEAVDGKEVDLEEVVLV